MSSANEDNFLSFLLSAYNFFSCLISLARDFSIILKSNEEGRVFYLNGKACRRKLSGKVSSFAPLRVLLAVGSVDMLYQVKEVPFISSLLRIFIVNECFLKVFFLYLLI